MKKKAYCRNDNDLLSSGQTVSEISSDQSSLLGMTIQEKKVRLIKACKDGDTGAVRQILEDDSSLVNTSEESGHRWALVHYAVENNNLELLEYLYGKGADINANDKELRTPLELAASSGETLSQISSLYI